MPPPLGLSQIGGLTIYAFSPSQLGVFAKPVQVADGQGFLPIASFDVLAQAGAVAALDGPMFRHCAGQNLPPGNAAYALSQCGYPEFLVYDASTVSYEGENPNEGITISIANGRASVARGARLAPNAQVAVQLFPTLVFEGAVEVSNSGTNANAERRAALAIFPDRLAFIVGASDMISFARAIRDLGAIAAGYTDGGGSTSLITPQGYYGAGEHRRVPTWLIVRGGGLGGAGAALVVGLATMILVGGILYATTRIRPKANSLRNPRHLTT